MTDVKYIRINSYDLLDENDIVLAANLQMDEQAVIDIDTEEVSFAVKGGPVMRPTNPR